ncbi:MAG: ATP-binding protein [Acidobacteriota bacterium]|nr:ATP-binding protein [Acidobacteriota bacterium]
MIQRAILPVMRRRLRASPAVALVGPRQSGKTTLARALPGQYFDLEQESDRLALDLQWADLQSGAALIVLDEAQAWPEVFARLRAAIDADHRRNGRFLLLGSVSPAMMVEVSESLAGRLALVELPPLSFTEMPRVPLGRLWSRGGYPDGGVLGEARYPHWQLDYLTLLAQRDLPAWGLPAKPQVTERLLRMTAAVNGQVWNATQIGQSLGLSYHTVNGYLDFLEGAFLIRRLPPYHANVGKRLVKSPKMYWRDSGLLHALLGVSSEASLLHQPWIGASWEGFVIDQLLTLLAQRDHRAEACFFRTSDQHEVDLVLDFGGRRWAIEIKLTSSPGPNDMRRLNTAADLIGAEKRILISQTRRSLANDREVSCSLPWFARHMKTALPPYRRRR